MAQNSAEVAEAYCMVPVDHPTRVACPVEASLADPSWEAALVAPMEACPVGAFPMGACPEEGPLVEAH